MLKVVLFGPYPVDPQYTSGGVEKVMFNTVEGLRELDEIDLHVVSLSRVDSDCTRQYDGFQVHHVKRQQRFNLPTFRMLDIINARRAIRRLDPDLIHCQESGHEAYISAPLSYPKVVTVHAVFRNEGVHYPGLRAKLRYWQFGFMARRAISGVDRYVPSSAYVSREMTEVSHKLREVVENPIEQSYFDVPDTPVEGRLLFAGTIYHRKGIEVLIDAAASLKERGTGFSVHIAGGIGDKAYHAGLLAQVERLGLGDDVIFRGFLTEEELAREFSEADLVVLPSYAETSPMTVQQAMAAGKPVVATRVGGVPQLIEEGASGRLVDAGDTAGLTDALASLLSDPEGRRAMGAHAKREAESRFSVGSVADKNIEVYRQLLKGGFAS